MCTTRKRTNRLRGNCKKNTTDLRVRGLDRRGEECGITRRKTSDWRRQESTRDKETVASVEKHGNEMRAANPGAGETCRCDGRKRKCSDKSIEKTRQRSKKENEKKYKEKIRVKEDQMCAAAALQVRRILSGVTLVNSRCAIACTGGVRDFFLS